MRLKLLLRMVTSFSPASSIRASKSPSASRRVFSTSAWMGSLMVRLMRISKNARTATISTTAARSPSSSS